MGGGRRQNVKWVPLFLPDYEEAVRALLAGDSARFAERTESWPVNVLAHARKIATRAFPSAVPS